MVERILLTCSVIYFCAMGSVKDLRSDLKLEALRGALAAVLTSKTFSKTPRLTALLDYLCVRYLHGDAESIKEYNIATDVFGRTADFDQGSDAIVRVEMHRLRKKLKEFYAGEGAEQAIEIVIQSGHYLPEFVVRPKDLRIIATTDSGLLSARPEAPFPGALRATQKLRLSIWFAASLVIVALVAVALISSKRTSRNQLSEAVATPSLPPVSAIPTGEGVRLLCGSSKSGYRDRQGREWGADAFYSGGAATPVLAQPIWRTRDPCFFAACVQENSRTRFR
ncbi:MAG: hypothetical protein ACR2IV_20885 [Bryobacteraceae bacterium]